MSSSPPLTTLRQAVLAVAVLDDVDLDPRDDGVRVDGAHPIVLGWDEIAQAVHAAGPAGTPEMAAVDPARAAIGAWLRIRTGLAQIAADPELAVQRLRLLGRPSDRVPDAGWARRRVPGGALALGLGLVVAPGAGVGVGVGVDAGRATEVTMLRGFEPGVQSRRPALGRDRLVVPVPDLTVVPVPNLALAAADRDAGGAAPPSRHVPWARLDEHLEAMGMLAGQRLERVPGQLEPMGDADVVTLLASRSYRSALAQGCPSGMRAAVVASRRRGWLDPRRLDPALAGIAFGLLDEEERAFERPLLVTAEEVVQARESGRTSEIDLRDPVHRQR